MRNFLNTIRNFEHENKRRWLIGLCSAMMLFIVAMWILYMDAFVFSDRIAQSSQASEIGFWSVLKNGLATVEKSVEENAGAFISDSIQGAPLINNGNNITIENPNTNR